MELKYLITFSTLAQTLSFTRTSELLYMSHSTVSKHLSALEHELGVQLIERDTHSVSMTEAGMVFLARIEPALRMLNEAKSAAGDTFKIGESASLRIGVDRMMQESAEVLGRVMDGVFMLKQELPRLDIRLFSLDQDEIEDTLFRNEIDLGIMVYDMAIQPDIGVLERQVISVDAQLLVMPRLEGLIYDIEHIGELAKVFKTAYIASRKQIYPSAFPMFSSLGIQPDIELVDGFASILYNVCCNNGMTICPKSYFRRLNMSNMVGMEISQSVSVTACFKSRSTCPYIQPLIKCWTVAEGWD